MGDASVEVDERERNTHSLLLSVLDTLNLHGDNVSVPRSTHDLSVELELESLLGVDLLEVLAVKRGRRRSKRKRKRSAAVGDGERVLVGRRGVE